MLCCARRAWGLLGGERHMRITIRAGYGIAVFFVLLNSITPFFTHGIAYRDTYAYPCPALLYPLYFLFFVLLIVWGTVRLMRAVDEFSTKERPFLILFLVVHVLSYVGGIDNFLIMADIRLFPLYPFGLYLVPLYAVAGTFALTRLI